MAFGDCYLDPRSPRADPNEADSTRESRRLAVTAYGGMMGLYEITNSGLEERKVQSFASLGMKERDDLQRLLRDQIDVLDEDLLVLSEEFGNWEGAKRRIDLLALDPAGRLVVIELKRTDDGGHMELQAIRYAAMVSVMGFDEVVETYAKHCATHRSDETVDARAEIEDFLTGDGDETPTISTDVRIILVSADFGLEITTAVLWLNRLEGMDIRCVRLRAYTVEGKTLIDVQQVLPLPEAGDYQVKIRRKELARERSLTNQKDYTQFQIVVDGQPLPAVKKRHAVRTMMAELIKRGVSLAEIDEALPGSRLRIVDGQFLDRDAVEEALVAADPDVDLVRWFSQYPFVEADMDRTWVLSNQWGTKTLPALEALDQAFTGKGVTYQEAEVV